MPAVRRAVYVFNASPSHPLHPHSRQRPPAGIAEKYKELLYNNRLKDPDTGVEYFKTFLRSYYAKGSQHVYLYRFLQLLKCWGGQRDHLTWITEFEIKAWMDVLPVVEIDAPAFLTAAQQEPAFLQAQSPADQQAALEDLHALH